MWATSVELELSNVHWTIFPEKRTAIEQIRIIKIFTDIFLILNLDMGFERNILKVDNENYEKEINHIKKSISKSLQKP